jgi:Cu(I)/Ag(I) efflux system membrane protein CusA/SilA
MTNARDHEFRYTPRGTLLDRLIRFCLENKLVTLLFAALIVFAGVYVAPFDWNIPWLQRNPVNVDAIPDIGENQQIVFTEWPGRSPRDVEDQVTYPLTTALLGVPRVQTIRSVSMFGFSSIYIIFHEDADFYDSRARILEKLNSLSANLLPADVQPTLGPDATALGQVFWYTLEGRDTNGAVTGGWDLQELRTIQDWQVRYALQAADGVSEVASVGGFVKEYQVDVDPAAMRVADVTLDDVSRAVQDANIDVGAGVIAVNDVEYLVRSRGYVTNVADIAGAVVRVHDNVPLYVRNVANVAAGPALRTGILDKEGTEAVGGVVTVRHGANPLVVIKNVKRAIAEVQPSLPRKTLPDGRESQVTIVPFYDRTGLIYETLGTLSSALYEQILVTTIVVLLMVMNLGSSILITLVMPLAVLIAFLAMKLFGVDANIVSLSGIAIAIGTLVDMGVIMCENIQRHLQMAPADENRLEVVYRAASEVGSAVLTAITTTVIGFLPVFALQGAEGKLFRPLAFTKTFALIGSVGVALTIVPVGAYLMTGAPLRRGVRGPAGLALLLGGAGAFAAGIWWCGLVAVLAGAWLLVKPYVTARVQTVTPLVFNYVLVVIVAVLLCLHWLPLGPEQGILRNVVFGGGLIAGLTMLYMFRQTVYGTVLSWCLRHKLVFLTFPAVIIMWGLLSWLGFARLFGWLPQPVRTWRPIAAFAHAFPGLGREFMPPLDEGSFLYMPTTMAHASIGAAYTILQAQDTAIHAIPEVVGVVGKIGRADTALDPAPISMIETVINYAPEYLSDRDGRRLTFAFTTRSNDYVRDEQGTPLYAPDGQPYFTRGQFLRDAHYRLIPAPGGKPFRLWRPALDPALNPSRSAWPGVRTPDDIWNAIAAAAEMPGVTAAPKLQPIAARIVMLQSGVRAAMAIKIKGPTLTAIEQAGIAIERLLREIPSIEPSAVVADRIIGKPYLEIDVDRAAIARYGVRMNDIQQILETAIGGMPLSTTVEGRERYVIRVRYARELRDSIEALDNIIVPTPTGAQIPLTQLARVTYARGPEMINSENAFLVGHVLFDKQPGIAEVDAVEQARDYLQRKQQEGVLRLPAGVSYSFAGSYENSLRAQRRLAVVIPIALASIFLVLYLQFRSVTTTLLVYSAVPFIAAGGFILIWLYAQPWFLNFAVAGVNMRALFQVHNINLSVAIWVGFIALFGLATDDGVVMATYLEELFRGGRAGSVADVRALVLAGGSRRVRACMMTTATTVLALLPVLTATGRGADIMVPMAIPTFGGMIVEMFTTLIVPVLYGALQERRLRQSPQRV